MSLPKRSSIDPLISVFPLSLTIDQPMTYFRERLKRQEGIAHNYRFYVLTPNPVRVMSKAYTSNLTCGGLI